MNPTELMAFLHEWLTEVLPAGTPIIRSHQNAPAPGAPFVTIDLEGEWDSFGFASQGIAPSGATIPEQVAALSTRIKDYTVAVALWEADGDGEFLRTAVESLETKRVAAMFHNKRVSVLSYGSIVATPILSDMQWRTEHRLPLSLHIARTFTDATNYIETAEFTNTIGG